MTPTSVARSTREIVAALMVTIVGVVALDVTAIVVEPATSSGAATAGASPMAVLKPAVRMLRWAGQEWEVAPPTQPGPDSDAMSDSHAAAHVDSRGRLHLAMTKVGGAWRSVELVDPTPATYGTYRFVIDAAVSTLAKPLDLGMFVIRPGAPTLTNEVDLEDSRALIGMHHGLDAQYVVQPYTKPHHLFRYAITHKVHTTTQSFKWIKNDVKFTTRKGSGAHAPLLAHFHYHGSSAPTSSNMSLRLNLFIHGHSGTVQGGPKSVILDSFTYTPGK